MTKHSKALLASTIVAIAAQAALAHDCDFPLTRTFEDSRELRFSPTSDHREIVVNNFNGPIQVVGYDGDSVALEVTRKVSARNDERLAVALEEVNLDIEEQGDAIVLYVVAPYRLNDGRSDYRGCRHYGYKNHFVIRLRVPFETDLYAETTESGDIDIENVRGKVSVHNINGSILAKGLTGPTVAKALNGRVAIDFDQCPTKDSSFGSLNGDLDINFPADLDADLHFETMNGKIFSDFDIAPLPAEPEGVSAQFGDHGLKVYSSSRSNGVRIGKGGPRFEFSTLNGDIFIKKLDTL